MSILIEGDCLSNLKKLKGSSIDLIIIDPPYNLKIDKWDVWDNVCEVTEQLYRVLKDDSSMFVFSGWSFVQNLLRQMDVRFNLKDWIIYDRIKGRGTKKSLVSTREDLLWYTKGGNYTFNKEKAYSTIEKKTKGMGSKNGKKCRALSNVWTDISPLVPWCEERKRGGKHKTQKPVAIIERILNTFGTPGMTVLDCYAGSGTTGEACDNLGFKGILIENDPESIRTIKNRLEV